MLIKNKMMPGIAVLGAALALPALAYDVDQISINGFGSIIAAQTLDNDEALYGNDNDLSFQNESRFALQVAAPIGEKFSATAQILAKGVDDFEPVFEWAYLSYQAADNFIVMAGRQRINLYKYSDYVDVGYAYHWIRPPQWVYSVPFNSGNGLGFLYNTALGDVDFNFTYKFIGEDISDYAADGELADASLTLGMSHFFNVDFTWNDLNFGANYGLVPQFSLTSLEFSALEAVLPEPIMSEVRVDEEKITFVGTYIGYDPGDWFILAEYTQTTSDEPNALSDEDSLYFSAGVRINQFTIHGTYGIQDADPTTDVYKLVTNPQLQAAVKQLVTAKEEDSKIYGVGVRWEVESGIALKADYTTYSDDLDKTADADLISAGIDFVF